MHRLARLLPTSAPQLSRSIFACQRSDFSLPHRLSACSSSLPVWLRHARFLSSDSAPEHHPVTEQLRIASEKPLQPLEERWKDSSKKALEDVQNRPPANPYAGRSVVNNSEKQVANSLRQLEAILARNKVRQQLRLTERHEKKGVKRRRLSSERWRKRFADEVRKKVQLVIKIRDRGA